MSEYSKITDFAAKDALSTGNPAKIVKGTEIDDELVAISGAVASKADKASPTFTGTPAAPTASSGTSTTQIATTAFAMGAAALVMPSGAMLQWPTSSAPTGFLLCTGAAVSRTIYAALFAVIGTTFGSGDGTTTFNLPDFDNRFAVGAGAHDPDRARKLLLNRGEIERLHDRVARERLSLVPLAFKLVDGRVKVELALARGRRKGDKRQVIAERDVQREMQRSLGRKRKGMI